MMLADFGARVVQVESPNPPADITATQFPMLLRNKERLTLDLKSQAGRLALGKLAERADVVVEGFRPGAAAKLGADYDTLGRANPRLVYCSITGYGQESPLGRMGGHDVNFLARAGLLELILAAPAQGGLPALQFADTGGAMLAALAIVVALFRRERTGRGARLDVPMTDAVLMQACTSSVFASLGWPHQAGCTPTSGGLACYRAYRTADGGWLAVGALEAGFFRSFCQAIGHPEWATRQYLPGEQRALIAQVGEIVAAAPLAEWERRFDGIDCCTTAARRFLDALVEPEFLARGTVREVAGQRLLGTPVVTVGEGPPSPGFLAEPGQHTQAWLQELELT
jgi:crotonobetainyl-CoA:carnitine CoA-transferase CaiB-like acyl-CoA transferase